MLQLGRRKMKLALRGSNEGQQFSLSASATKNPQFLRGVGRFGTVRPATRQSGARRSRSWAIRPPSLWQTASGVRDFARTAGPFLGRATPKRSEPVWRALCILWEPNLANVAADPRFRSLGETRILFRN